MFEKLRRRARLQDGAAPPLTVAVVLVALLVAAAASVAFTASSARAWDAGEASAQNLASVAANEAEALGRESHGYRRVTRRALHELAGLPTAPSSPNAWVSAARGSRHGFSVTATAYPSGNSYELSVSATGTVTRDCTVTLPGAGLPGCRHAPGSYRGSW